MPNAATILVGLSRWDTLTVADVKSFVDAIPALGNPTMAAAAMNARSRTQVAEFYRFADSTNAMFEGYPLTDALRKNTEQMTVMCFRAAHRKAGEILGGCIRLSNAIGAPTPVTRGPKFSTDFPELRIALRELKHRFSIPWLGGPGVPADINVSGWGTWHPVIESFDDILTWATAGVLSDKLAPHIGRCEFCQRYYFSRRAGRHRFCPDADCRDLFWRAKTGTERSKRSRKQRSGREGYHVEPH